MRTKVFAAYLPQYHVIPENDKFWGKGYTDWIATKNATPQYQGHIQPRVPLDKNYYDLTDIETIKWQTKLAREYRVDGFNIYHYWFENSHKVLEKPAEILLKHPEVDIEYFFSWDNTSWRSGSWTSIFGKENKRNIKYETLLKVDYGNEDEWKRHFDYLLPFFLDRRYMKIDGKPVFALMRTADEQILIAMKEKWNLWALKNGLGGVHMISGARVGFNHNVLDGLFEYQPRIAAWGRREAIEKALGRFVNITNLGHKKYYYDYDKVWQRIIKDARRHINSRTYFSGVVKFDDTPRRGEKARILLNSNPEKFEKYFSRLYQMCNDAGKELLLLTAWNEWGEGACLEPDTVDGYTYLEALKRVLEGSKTYVQ
nr:glycoside hydrolase family 99-like domain-containing protein [uncultured Acetatifactor sp.]